MHINSQDGSLSLTTGGIIFDTQTPHQLLIQDSIKDLKSLRPGPGSTSKKLSIKYLFINQYRYELYDWAIETYLVPTTQMVCQKKKLV